MLAIALAAMLPGAAWSRTGGSPSIVAASPSTIQTSPGTGTDISTPDADAASPAKAAPADGSAGTAPTTTAAKASIPQFYKPVAGIGQPSDHIGLQPQETALGRQAAWFHDAILLPIIIAISLLVLVLLLWVMARHNRRTNPVPSTTSHNTVLEVAWTVVPVLILAAMAIPSIGLLAAQYDTPKPDLTVKVIGHQWYWSYQYPDNGDFEVVSNILKDDEDKARGEPRLLGVDERMVVPAGAVVKVITTSDDVIHSFAVPAFWTKMDAVPGRLNETWFKVDKPGVYYGQCSELCGARHAYMPIAVEVVTRPQFAQWIAARGGTMPGAVRPTSPDATVNSPISNPSATTAKPDGFAAGVKDAPTVDATATAKPAPQGATVNQ
jgi:cytochrome c oxidase subunit 2